MATTPTWSLALYESTPGFSAAISGTWPGSTPNSRSAPGAVTSSTSVSTSAPRGVVSDNFTALRRLFLHLLVARAHVVEAALHVERLLRDVIALAVDDLLEAADSVLDLDVLAGRPGERLGHEERLRQELLDLAGARHRQLVVLAELVHPQDGDDVDQLLVLLQDLLHRARRLVVLGADDVGRQDRRRGVQRIDGRVDPQLGDPARQHGRRVQVRERRG